MKSDIKDYIQQLVFSKPINGISYNVTSILLENKTVNKLQSYSEKHINEED